MLSLTWESTTAAVNRSIVADTSLGGRSGWSLTADTLTRFDPVGAEPTEARILAGVISPDATCDVRDRPPR